MVVIATTASAQLHIAVEAGLNVNLPHDYNNQEIKKMIDPKNSLGWFVGPKLMYMTPLGFGADGALLFSQLKNDQGESTKNLQYINVPINLRYQFSLLGLCGIYVAVGPQWSVNIGDREWSWNDATNVSSIANNYYKVATKKHNISANLGFGAIILDNIHVGVNWNVPVTSGGEFIYQGTQSVAENWRNNTWQVRLAYYFK